MVCCQFQALRAETERLRAADLAATLLLSEKEEAAATRVYGGLIIRNLQKPGDITGFRAISGCKFGMGNNKTEDQFKKRFLFWQRQLFVQGEPVRTHFHVWSKHGFLSFVTSIPFLLLFERNCSIWQRIRVLVELWFMLACLRSQERCEYMQEQISAVVTVSSSEYTVYLYLSIHAWDV